MSDYPAVNDLLIAADILITDYSAIAFDYSILCRPIFCYLLKGNKRLAQDCRRKYGENLLIYEIDSLKPYSEHLIDTISAKKIMTEKIFDRVHTYTTDGTYEVVDIFKEKFDLLHGIKIFCRAYVRK